MVTLSLDNLSVVGVSPVEFVDIAANSGFDEISVFAGGLKGPLYSHRLSVGDPQTEAMKRRLGERGVAINNLEGLVVMPGITRGDFSRMIDVAVHLGARAGVTLIFDPEPARAADSFAELCEMARQAGLPLLLEFAAVSEVKSLREAIDYIDRSGEQLGLLVDVLHLSYASETPQDIARVAPGRVQCAQICDSPAKMTLEEYADHCMFNRAAPGDGELPVAAFLAALPEGIPIGVEAPLRPLIERGVPALDRARLLNQKVRACLAAAGRG